MIAGVMLCVAFLGAACSKKQKTPEGILGRDEMVKAITEVLVAEEKVNRMLLNGDSSKLVFAIMRKKVFERTGVDDSAFYRSMDYYIDRPKELEQIYAALVDSLNLKEQRASVKPADAPAK